MGPMLNPSGEEDPKLPSILADVPTWQAPTLVLHGELDLLVSVQQANLLWASLEAAKKPNRLVLYPYYGHVIPREAVQKEAIAFLENLRIRLPWDRFDKIGFRYRSCLASKTPGRWLKD